MGLNGFSTGLRWWRKKEEGYTAAEMAIAMAILGVVIFTTLLVYKTISRAYWQVDEKSRLERVILFTMNQMTQEIRQARDVTTLGAPAGTIWSGTTVHLDAAGNTVCGLDIPNLKSPLSPTNDATLTYFLHKMPDGTVKLFQRMQYYNGAYTQAFPAMAETDQYRMGKPVATPAQEPDVGTPTPSPSNAATPTPVYNTTLGQMPGLYNSSSVSYDDVSFFYDPTNRILAVGLTVSLKSKSLSFFSGPQRRRLSLSTSVALRAQ